MARRTTVLQRRREAFRRCSALSRCLSRPQPARHGVRARKARVLRLLPRDSQRSGARARATQKLGWRRRLQLARRITVLQRRREAFRRNGPLSHSAWTDHNQQRGTTCASSELACCASSRETASAVARAHVPRESWLCVGGHSWHVAPRSCNKEERRSAGTGPFYGA